jgi:hypothetical protein
LFCSHFRTVAHSVAAVDALSGFLRDMRARYPGTGAQPAMTAAPAIAPPRTSVQPTAANPAGADPTPTGSTPPPRLSRTATR